MDTQVAEFDTCQDGFYDEWENYTEKWEELVDLVVSERLAKETAGEIKYDFIRNWPSGQIGFNSLEWRQNLREGKVVKADEEDISSKIEAISMFMGQGGGQCSAIKGKEFGSLTLKIYGIIIAILAILLLGRSVKVLGHRLIE